MTYDCVADVDAPIAFGGKMVCAIFITTPRAMQRLRKTLGVQIGTLEGLQTKRVNTFTNQNFTC